MILKDISIIIFSNTFSYFIVLFIIHVISYSKKCETQRDLDLLIVCFVLLNLSDTILFMIVLYKQKKESTYYRATTFHKL